MCGRSSDLHTPSKNPPPVSQVQAYIAYPQIGWGCGGGKVASWWVFLGATYFFWIVYASGMDTQKRELWDRLTTESERAHHAFQCFLNLPSGERTLLAAYKLHVDNPNAGKPSDTWSRWSSEFAWRERARAYDHHLELIRLEGQEEAIREEAKFQTRQTEQLRNRMLELMTMGYDAAMSWFEDPEWTKDNLRSGDVVRIMALHVEAAEKFGALKAGEGIAEGDWDESKLEKDAKGDAEVDRILADARTLREKRRAEGHVDEPEEDLL